MAKKTISLPVENGSTQATGAKSYWHDLAVKLLAVSLVAGGITPAWAGPNDFFGGMTPGAGFVPPGAVGSLETGADDPTGAKARAPQSAPAPSSSAVPGLGGGPGPTDYTADEKRMQKKWKANMGYFKDLIAKGEAMMKKAPNKDDKMYKRGRILKETGEKHLTELQANSQFALDPLDGSKDKDKDKAKDGKKEM